jgi:hypothetical protein
MDDSQRRTILDEIIAATERPERLDYQITRREYQERLGITRANAESLLMNGVMNNTLLREKRFVGGKEQWVYWRPEDEPQ